ncbi:adhesin [Methanobrevibacter sp. DSM 116169]|uniref:adhesin n=1 Tax=Methanobrevibacter sp. DSM 116169 TaxID=3242727 RepID=UPI0038FC751D
MKKPKFTIVDYLIIIAVIAAVVFAFIHISTDNPNESTSFDASTMNKIGEKYLSHYREGKIVEATIVGYNATNGEKQEIHGEVIWLDETPSNTKILVNVNGTNVLAAFYSDVPQASFYIETISLESSDKKHQNLTEITVEPKNITTLNDLTENLNNTDYEITTFVSINDLDNMKIQEVINSLYKNNLRISIKSEREGAQNQIEIQRATSDEISIANDILGESSGLTDKITIRLYNASESDIDSIPNKINVRKIS